ncbi:MAG: hypothetical protein LKE64_00905 [Solobacterium sp.]|jgi:hypothetical protein|nr:hypothetical protein [Solobacterium sp.]MCH4050001.1 hypothetical protein [Solobacterium sp.]MCH4073686.1 hypothetical protein [Solobacterium sp.]MCI1313175.1 hypothetical protein [Solobacterium sp.]MCI1346803.1 hypothetical protein [Solobacterium sp.]
MSDTALLDEKINALKEEIDVLSVSLEETDPGLLEVRQQLQEILTEIQKGRISLSLLYHLLVTEVRYRKICFEQYRIVLPVKYTDAAEDLFAVLKKQIIEMRK